MNWKMVGIITLGQFYDHGLAMMKQMVTTYQPQGLVHEFITQANTKYKPEDVSTGIEMDNDLERLELKGTANDFYNLVIAIQVRYGCTKLEVRMIMAMTNNTNNSTYAKTIIDHLNYTSKPLFLRHCAGRLRRCNI